MVIPTKVTKDEKLEELGVEAINKAIAIVKERKDEVDMEDPRERIYSDGEALPLDETITVIGEDVKTTKPKAEKVPNAPGGDEQADNRTSRDA